MARAPKSAPPETRGKEPPRTRNGDLIWQDAKNDPPPAPPISVKEAVDRLENGDPPEARERAIQYVDLFMEYREATLNIRKYGVVTFNALCQAVENPYMPRRDKARQSLASQFRDIEAPWLWKELAE